MKYQIDYNKLSIILDNRYLYICININIGYPILWRWVIMEGKDCKIVCNDKTIAVIKYTKDGINFKCTDEGKEFCKDCCKELKGCC